MARQFTDKQRVFIDAYIITLNGYTSAKLARYKGSYETLQSIASENLRKPHIRAEIDRRLADLSMAADEVVARVARIARGSMADFLDIDENGASLNFLKAKELGVLDRVKKYKETETRQRGKDGDIIIRREIELYSADSALDKLIRVHGMYNDKMILEDWKTELIALLRDGKVTSEEITAELGEALAKELFTHVSVS